jgi:amino acid adenylation domain-containing protein
MSMQDALAGLTPEQRALVELKLRARGAAVPSIGRRSDSAETVLSFAQERLWLVEQLQRAGAANHLAAAVRLSGHLSLDTLERSLTAIVDRHEVLRTGYADTDGRLVQRIHRSAPCAIPVLEVPGGTETERLHEAARLARLEAERPFDLAAGPMLRAALVRLSDIDHVLVLALHHIAADGWSLGVIVGELTQLYTAFHAAQPSPLPPLPIQYADFAVWQRQQIEGARLAGQLDWWRRELAGLPALVLPTDRPRPARASSAGARESIALAPQVGGALQALARREKVTPFTILFAAFQVLVRRWAGQTSFGIGTPVAARNAAELEGLVGLFVNMLVLRADLADNPPFSELLTRVHARMAAALARQDVPFERLVEDLGADRTLSHATLTPVVFAVQNVPTRALDLPGLAVSSFELERTTARFDLCLFMTELGDGWHAAVEYRTDVFDATTIRRFLGSYARLVGAAVADPAQRIEDLPLLTAGERRRILVDWNATDAPYPDRATIHGLVSAAARARPDAVAVGCGSDRLTYAQLEAHANRVARAIRRQGVAAGARVGVCLDRTLNLIPALLGILKAGCAYVPLDPGLPPQRLAYMAMNAGIHLVLTARHLQPSLDACAQDVVALDLDETAGQDAELDGAPADVEVRPDDLAYVSYTSGSTGRPKGVEVTHRAVVWLLCGADYVRLGKEEALLQLAPVAFDASTFEIWGALIHGGRLAVYPDRVPDFAVLEDVLRREGITTLWLTSSLYNALIDRVPQALAGVRQLLIGGEALSVEHVRRGLAALPRTTFINGYGPTEGTTFTCCHRITEDDVGADAASVPIGRPIANTRVYVLDDHQQPVPSGVAGELYVGGDGLARGYAAAPRLTAERFVPDAVSGRRGARLYRTGDLVRYRHDGVIEFLGRRDEQVKMRGHRIELGEVEAALRRHPAVSGAVVVVAGAGDEAALAAYVVPAEGAAAATLDLRGFLKAQLPDYMVPAAIATIPALPLTANGKVDRRALPPVAIAPAAERPRVAPRNEVEEVVAARCRELLQRPTLSMLDNFFELGGHSLLAAQLASRLRGDLGAAVTLRQVFEASNLAELSDSILDDLIEQTDAESR